MDLPGKPITYPCGCVNYTCPSSSGVLQSLVKCAFHKAESGRGGLKYYTDMGCLAPMANARYEAELLEPLERMGASLETPDGLKPPYRMLDIGSGVSQYAPLFMRLGYIYFGIEPDKEAAEYARKTLFGKPKLGWVSDEPFEQAIVLSFPCDGSFDVILAAHVLEHMVDPFMAMRRIYQRLKPSGRLVIIVPDDSDPVNPDHLWFFTEETLRVSMEQAGFMGKIKMCVRRRVAHENFIYATAVKV